MAKTRAQAHQGRDLDVCVAIPSLEDWKAKFGISLAGIVAVFSMQIGAARSQNLRLFTKQGSILPKMRHELVDYAMKDGCSHLFFVDSDMEFPTNTLRNLLTREKKVIAANCAIKLFPSAPTARVFDPNNDRGKLLFTRENSHGVQQVWRIGTGVMLLDLQALAFLPPPWFQVTWREDAKTYEGEDWNFCRSLEEHNVPIFIDHDVSKTIGHLGEMRYDYSLVEPEVEEVESIPQKLTMATEPQETGNGT